MTQLLDKMFVDIEKLITRFVTILEGHGVQVTSQTLTDLIKQVEELKTMKKDIDYVGLVKDHNGYVVKAFKLADFVEIGKCPKHFTEGFYKYEDGKFVLDEQRYRQIREV